MNDLQEISNDLNLLLVEIRTLNHLLERIGDIMISQDDEK